MCKWISVILAVLLACGIGFYIYSWGDAKEKIDKAEKDLSDYKTRYDSIIQKGDRYEKEIAELRKVEAGYEKNIDSLQRHIESLNTENKNYKLMLRDLFQPDDLVNQMRIAFPELKTSPIGVARIPHPQTGFLISTFQVPVQFVATFISDHKDVEIFKKQLEAMGGINAVYKKYVTLQDSIIFLKEQKASAYKEGLDYGLKRYEDLMKEYISTLKNPPKIEWPSVTSIIAAGAAGVAAGVLIKK